MELRSFSAERFRNLSEVQIRFAPGMNVIYGGNAQGKTNLLEAIFVLSMLRSFRTRHLPEAVQFSESTALLHGTVQSGQSKHVLTVSLEERQKVAWLDRKKVEALHYLGVFNVFLFSLPLLEVVRGGPEERRKFLDRSIAISKPGYLPLLIQYHRAVKQKNALLLLLQRGEISRKDGLDEIGSFNQQLLEHGLEIAQHRATYLARLQELLPGKQPLFFEDDLSLGVELRSSFLASREEVHKALERSMDREIARGACLIGVHRDEVSMTVNGKELRKYGSSGQHRGFLLLMLLAQLQLYEQWREERPVLLLDDLDSELDQERIQRFLEEIRNRYQTLISSSREELFSGDGSTRLFEIRAGNILER